MATMTKSEAIDLGRAAGRDTAERIMNEQYLRETPVESIGQIAGEYASIHTADKKIRNASYFDAYKDAFLTVYRNRHNELPEVKAARQLEYLRHRLEGMVSSADSTLAKFQANFTENPLYAFEWAQGAIEAAAKKQVALHLKGVLEHENGGFEATMEVARRQAIQGARWPSHSTSPVSNLAKEATTAAYAEVVSDIY